MVANAKDKKPQHITYNQMSLETGKRFSFRSANGICNCSAIDTKFSHNKICVRIVYFVCTAQQRITLSLSSDAINI